MCTSALRPPSSGSFVHYFSLFPARIAPLNTRDPVCGERQKRSGRTKGLAAINFTQATFAIVQRDRRLIALTLSQRRACPSQPPALEPSHIAFIRPGERKCFFFYSSAAFFIFLSVAISILRRKIKQHVRQGYGWPL